MIREENQSLLLTIARRAIETGLQSPGSHYSPDERQLPAELKKNGATFVTLQVNHRLRGCIGSLEAYRPLTQDVAANAYAAAFSDPRFSPLSMAEFHQLHLSISILTEPHPIEFSDEPDLLRQLQPGKDGLILESGHHRSTFLPSVWETLPDKTLFIEQLKRKAGLPESYWSDQLRVSRYHTESFGCDIKPTDQVAYSHGH
ncbi:MAG: AmmeMemoRadiSam system protein A [Gammaproteobacteria bacterium]|nr:AmmeMemoRadiSam system protein A [Gammaproteobacteria bacterium]